MIFGAILKLASGVAGGVVQRLPNGYVMGAGLAATILIVLFIWHQGNQLDAARVELAGANAEIKSLELQRDTLRQAIITQNEQVHALQTEADKATAAADYRAREIRRLMADLRPTGETHDLEGLNEWTRALFSH